MLKIISSVWHAMLSGAPLPQWWKAGAAMAMTILFAVLIWVFWKAGFWPSEAWHVRADWLGVFGLCAAFLVLISVVALMDVRVAFRASKQGLDANIAGDDAAPLPNPDAGTP